MKKQIKIEKKLIKILKEKRLRIYIFLVSSIALFIIPMTPYISILINLKTALLAMTLIFFLLFSVSQIKLFLLISLLFIICAVFLLLGQFDRAEEFGNYIFTVLIVQAILFLKHSYDEKNQK